jgi:molybdopterin converting factor small subunit
MQIKIFGTLRLLLGRKTVQLDLPAGTALEDVLRELARQFPPLRAELWDADGRLRPDLPLFLNGRNPRLLPRDQTAVLGPADELCLFSPVSSGRLNVAALREEGGA